MPVILSTDIFLYNLCNSSALIYLISDSPYNLQISGLLGVDLNLFANVSDMYGNGIVRTYCLLVPDHLVDLVNGKYPSLILNKKKENIVFNGCKLNGFIVNEYFLGIVVDDESPNLIYLIG